MNQSVRFVNKYTNSDYSDYSSYLPSDMQGVPVKVTLKNNDVLTGILGNWVDEQDNYSFDAYEFRTLDSEKYDYHDIPDADVVKVEVI